jgi:hypothetical protein
MNIARDYELRPKRDSYHKIIIELLHIILKTQKMLVAWQSVVVHCFFLYCTVLRRQALNTEHGGRKRNTSTSYCNVAGSPAVKLDVV